MPGYLRTLPTDAPPCYGSLTTPRKPHPNAPMLIQFALTLVVLLGFCGLAIDVGLLELKKLHLQSAADAAALGYLYGGQNEGLADSALNGFANGVNSTTVAFSVLSQTSQYPGAIQATVTQEVNPIFFPGTKTLSAQATTYEPPAPCVNLLSTITSTASLTVSSEYASASCPFYLGRSMTVDSQSRLSTTATAIKGASNLSSISPGTVTPIPTFNAATVLDPLSYVTQPTFVACTAGNTAKAISGYSLPLSPGTYCGGLTIHNNAVVSFKPGLYIITGGLSINAYSVVTGTGVTLFLTSGGGCSTCGYGAFSVSGSSVVSLTAPTTPDATGAIPGVLVFVDRNWKTGGQAISLTTSSVNTLDGVIYAPYMGITASSIVSCNNYLEIVADSMSLSGSSFTIKSNYSSLQSGNPLHGSGGETLVE